ncbi:hypothetical protein RFI_20191, partial [Reticulomyxa filosa]
HQIGLLEPFFSWNHICFFIEQSKKVKFIENGEKKKDFSNKDAIIAKALFIITFKILYKISFKANKPKLYGKHFTTTLDSIESTETSKEKEQGLPVPRKEKENETSVPIITKWANVLKVSENKLIPVLSENPELYLLDTQTGKIECRTFETKREEKKVFEKLINKNLIPRMQYLTNIFGGEKNVLNMFFAEPKIMLYSVLEIRNKVSEVNNELNKYLQSVEMQEPNKPKMSLDRARRKRGKMTMENAKVGAKEAYIMDLIQKQPTILIQDTDHMLLPRIHFLQSYLKPSHFVQLSIQLPSIIQMELSNLIRIAFLAQVVTVYIYTYICIYLFAKRTNTIK